MAQLLFEKELDVLRLTRYAYAALTENKFVKSYASDPAKVQPCATAGELALGVADGSYDADHEACGVKSGGYLFVVAGAAVSVGDFVATDTSARAIRATADHAFVLGVAMTAASAAGDIITIRFEPRPNFGAQLSLVGGLVKVKKIAIAHSDGTAETDTGWDIPANAAVLDVLVHVTTAEATGATKTIDVGTDGSGSNDPDGFVDGLSVAATGWKRPAPTLSGSPVIFADATQGDLLWTVAAGTNADDRGAAMQFPDLTSGGESLTWTPGSADFAELHAEIYVLYVELA